MSCRGRGFTHVCVDHRPTKVLVSGYEDDEKADVLTHFAVSILINIDAFDFIYKNR